MRTIPQITRNNRNLNFAEFRQFRVIYTVYLNLFFYGVIYTSLLYLYKFPKMALSSLGGSSV